MQQKPAVSPRSAALPRFSHPPRDISTFANHQAWYDALTDPKFREALDEGLADVEAGRVTPWEEIESQLPSS